MALSHRTTESTFTNTTNTASISNSGMGINPNTTISLYDGDEHITLTPKILKRIIEMVKKEYPEDFI